VLTAAPPISGDVFIGGAVYVQTVFSFLSKYIGHIGKKKWGLSGGREGEREGAGFN